MYPLGHKVSEISSTGMTRGFVVDVEKLQGREVPGELFVELLTMAAVLVILL